MTTWTDKTGRTLTVMPADGDKAPRLVIALPGIAYHPAAFFLDGNADLAEIAVAMLTANGQPAPVILPRPDIDTSTEYSFGPLRMRVSRARGVNMSAGNSSWHYDPSSAREAAGTLAALADVAGQEPDSADVERMAALVTEASRMAPDDAARYLLRKGVTLPGERDGNG